MSDSVDHQVPVITVHETASRWCPVIEAYVLMSMVESATGILIFDLSLFSALSLFRPPADSRE